MRGNRNRRRHARFRQFFDQQRVAQRIERRAAEVFRNRRGEETLLRRSVEQLDRWFFALVGVLRHFRHFLRSEIAEEFAKTGLFFGQCEIHTDLRVVTIDE